MFTQTEKNRIVTAILIGTLIFSLASPNRPALADDGIAGTPAEGIIAAVSDIAPHDSSSGSGAAAEQVPAVTDASQDTSTLSDIPDGQEQAAEEESGEISVLEEPEANREQEENPNTAQNEKKDKEAEDGGPG